LWSSGAFIALTLALALPAAVPCTPSDARSESRHSLTTDNAPSEKNRAERERCKKTESNRAPPKDCPDGGERLPQDKRSPLDNIPPLSPLVA
jgi:hypothetical protein